MVSFKCCVGGCDSTSDTHILFCMPYNDNLRNLWMSFLVPSNPELLGLTKKQLLRKRVCQNHFDETQFTPAGQRIRYSYPCLMTEMEITHGIPVDCDEYTVRKDHNYCLLQDNDEDVNFQAVVVMGMQDYNAGKEHNYSQLRDADRADLQNKDIVMEGEPLPSTSHAPMTTNYASVEGQESLHHHSSSSNQTKSHVQGVSMQKFKRKSNNFLKKCKSVNKNCQNISYSKRLQNAQRFAENDLQNFYKLHKRAQEFILMQLRLAGKNKMAKRFTLDDKLFALTLMKQSPKGYKLLEHTFILPCKRTLTRLSEKIIFECGINDNIFDHIKSTTKEWETVKRLCSLVFDEVALTPRLTYNECKDKIYGFVELEERKQKFADHALVFMIRGICSSWRQSIAYYFCAGTVSSAELQKIIKKIIARLYNTGLIPLAIVCDQGSTFRSCLKSFREDTARYHSAQERRDNSIHIAGHDLFVFFDPPHLLKGIRNNFIEKDIIINGKRASWKDILYIYDIDMKCGHTRALPKLTAEHVDPKKMKKMRVKTAAQVLSARTAAMLNYTHAVYNHLNDKTNSTMDTTAAVVSFFDELFDSVNGSAGQGTVKGKLRCAVKINSPHVEFWRNAIIELKKIKFEDCNSKAAKQAGKPKLVSIPSLNGWIVTLESFLGLSKLLFSKFGVEYLYPRHINQDPLENFFGRIRAINYRNINPDVNTFVYAFKSLVMSNILSPHSKFSNCEVDDGDTLINLTRLFDLPCINTESEPVNQQIPNVMMSPSSSKMTAENVIGEKVRVQTSAYTAGYVCRRLKSKFNCHACSITYESKSIQKIHEYVKYRKYKRLKNNNLILTNEKFLILYRESSQAIHDYLNKYCHQKNVKKNLIEIISKKDVSWLGCELHKLEIKKYFISIMIRLQVHNWCNKINKILDGKIPEKYIARNRQMDVLAWDLYKKYKLRKLKLNK